MDPHLADEADTGHRDFEVIVVDDRSIDDTASVGASFRDQLRLPVLRNEVNRGRSFSRNHGAAHASGEHLLFLDADSYARTDLVAGHRACTRAGRRPSSLAGASR